MYLGIEIGGTKLQLALGSGDGATIARWRGMVDPAAGGEGIRRQIVEAFPELLESAGLTQSAVRAAGVGFGGPVNDAARSTIKSHQICGWESFPLAKWIEDRFGIPAALGNDADCAGLAEAHLGAGRGFDPVFYITIGSGIGGGLIIDGQVYRGAGLGAAEIGHLRIRTPEGWSTLENLSSGWAIERRTGQSVADLAKCYHTDPSILNDAWTYLAEAICQVIALIAPARIIIGGGVSLVGEEVLFRPLRALVAERVFAPFADMFDIVPAELGEDVVLHGAILLARRTIPVD